MQDTSKAVLAGVNLLANTVKQTLGTKGRTILFNDENNRTHITKDGVTVARHIFSEDPYENMIMTVLREASLKTMKSSGDGTKPFTRKQTVAESGQACAGSVDSTLAVGRFPRMGRICG